MSLTFLLLAGYSQETGTFTDSRDGKVYKTVKIGTQWIMAENLAYKPSSGVYWMYKNDSSNLAKYGYLYDWETAKTVAPQGWHLPTKEEWKTFYNYLGGNRKKVFDAMIENGSSGFNALFSGWCGCSISYGPFEGAGEGTCFWSTTSGWGVCLYSDRFTRFASIGIIARMGNTYLVCGLSVRLFKD